MKYSLLLQIIEIHIKSTLDFTTRMACILCHLAYKNCACGIILCKLYVSWELQNILYYSRFVVVGVFSGAFPALHEDFIIIAILYDGILYCA